LDKKVGVAGRGGAGGEADGIMTVGGGGKEGFRIMRVEMVVARREKKKLLEEVQKEEAEEGGSYRCDSVLSITFKVCIIFKAP